MLFLLYKEIVLMSKIRKVIIPAAGLGTRFLPATKSMPKEMFPIIDMPTLQYIVQEAYDSGIEEVGIIVSREKPSIKEHFTLDNDLEDRLLKINKVEEVKMLRKIASLVNITYIYQNEPKGLGHAVLCAREFIDGEDFAIMLGDDLIVNNNGEPVLKQMINAYNNKNASILGVQEVEHKDTCKYGILKPVMINDRLIEIESVVEKPKVEESPSNYAVLGRYVLSNKIFDILENQAPGKGGEIQLTDALDTLIKIEKVYGYNFIGNRYDIGDKFGYIKAIIDFALEREDLSTKVMEYLKKVVK